MNPTRRIVRNSIAQFLAYGIRGFGILIVYAAIARTPQSTQLLGQYALLSVLLLLFSALATFGLPAWLTREIPLFHQDINRIGQIVQQTFGWVVVFSICTFFLLVGIGMIWGFSSAMQIAIVVAGLGLSFEAYSLTLMAVFDGTQQMQYSASVSIFREVLFISLALIGLYFSANIVTLMLAYVVTRVITFGIILIVYQAHFGNLQIQFGNLHSTLQNGFPYAVNLFLAPIYVRVDIIFLALLISQEVVGIYEAATSLTIRVNMLAVIVNITLLPHLVQTFQNPDALIKTVQLSLRLLLIVSLPITLMLLLFRHEILIFIYGETFVTARDVLAIFALLIPIRMLNNSFLTILTAIDRQTHRSGILFIATLVNLILNIFWIPKWHIMGATWATVITELIILSIAVWFLRFHIPKIVSFTIIRSAIVGIIPVFVLILWFDSVVWWGVILSSLALYTLIIFIQERPLFKAGLVQILKN